MYQYLMAFNGRESCQQLAERVFFLYDFAAHFDDGEFLFHVHSK